MNIATKTLKSLEQLMIAYLAEVTSVREVGGVRESDWQNLANRLAIPTGHVTGYWEAIGEERRESIWASVLDRRILNTRSHQLFRANTADRVASMAMDKIENLLASGMIRDTNELIAVVRMASPQPKQGVSVSINAGDELMRLKAGESLPGGDKVIRISLSPAVAQSVTRSRIAEDGGFRVIDAEMIGSEELRNIGKVVEEDE